jgi:hypothetical protein
MKRVKMGNVVLKWYADYLTPHSQAGFQEQNINMAFVIVGTLADSHGLDQCGNVTVEG